MRRSDHPSRPSAITCSRFSALKTLAIPAAGAKPTAQVNVSAPGAALAGFQVSINGRFWVSTEEEGVRALRCGKPADTAERGQVEPRVVLLGGIEVAVAEPTDSTLGTSSSPIPTIRS